MPLPLLRRVLTACVPLIVSAPLCAWAADFHVNPVVMSLARGAPSTQLEIENDSDEVVRFQVSVFSWDQTPTQELKLTPTDTLIAFPTLFSIEPHKKRTMRLGMQHPAGAAEETYRVIVEQLGEVRTSNAPANNGVKMLTRMSMPLFTEVEHPKPAAAFTSVSLAHGKLSWDTQSTGNVHITPRSVSIVGRDAKGAVIFRDEQKAWYVLSGHAHHNEVQIPAELCKKLKGIELMLNADAVKAGATITAAPQQCSG